MLYVRGRVKYLIIVIIYRKLDLILDIYDTR